jgi:Family of unknown function (DUF6011)
MHTLTRTNRYAGACASCGGRVAAEAGQLLGSPGAWKIEHNEGQCAVVPIAPVVTAELVTTGIYRHDGEVYVVVESKGQKDIPASERRRYAKRLVHSAARLAESEQVVDYEWEFDGGLIRHLASSERVSLEDEEIKGLMIRYGRCFCGRPLRAAESVARMVGPVCFKKLS